MSNSPSATPAAANPAAKGIVGFLESMGHKIEAFLPKIETVLSAAKKDLPTIEQDINLSLQAFDPALVIPATGLEELAGVGLNAATQTATALQNAGTNPTSVQVAAVAIASLVHALKLTPTEMQAALAATPGTQTATAPVTPNP